MMKYCNLDNLLEYILLYKFYNLKIHSCDIFFRYDRRMVVLIVGLDLVAPSNKSTVTSGPGVIGTEPEILAKALPVDAILETVQSYSRCCVLYGDVDLR